MFAGDTFVNRRTPSGAAIIENRVRLAESLDKLRKMSITTVYPGHGKPFLMADYLKAR